MSQHAPRRQAGVAKLNEVERSIYARQIQDPQFGVRGQLALKHATVMISRVGGLGGSVAMLLARAGIGRLILAHGGEVEPENVNRMPLAFREHIGQPRMPVFVETLQRINPDVNVDAVAEDVNEHNVDGMVRRADLVVDAAPLFEERYAMNRAAVRYGKPLVSAGMYALEGHVTTILPGTTPCFCCLFPEPPEDWNLRVFPVIAPSPMLVASIATMEAIKLITGIGETLLNRMLYSDLSSNTMRTLAVGRRPDCAVCSHLWETSHA